MSAMTYFGNGDCDLIEATLGSPGAVGQIMHLELEGGCCVLNYV
jgi:hypothetical protein